MRQADPYCLGNSLKEGGLLFYLVGFCVSCEWKKDSEASLIARKRSNEQRVPSDENRTTKESYGTKR